ncbi:hypothetical protein ATANTOWER_023460 [Ataeniobius toweri]|uniref:Uncharacterized protein n=1 Tax=Ataeniobius toweri TaxID=208326 RepID=A0ABU7BDD6_9TELE|nr:hypothetical protein [Ataeniobius toweri]
MQKKKGRQAIKRRPSDWVDKRCVMFVKSRPCRTVMTNVPYNWVNAPVPGQQGHSVCVCVSECVYGGYLLTSPKPTRNSLSSVLLSGPACILNEYFNDYLSILNEYLSVNPRMTCTAGILFLKKAWKSF